jgi:hypothetical protein
MGAATQRLPRPSHTAGRAFTLVRDTLEQTGAHIRPRGDHAFMTSCPLHTDNTPSLSVTWCDCARNSPGGMVLLHCFSCHAGVADITAAIGLQLADLFDGPPTAPTTTTTRSTRVDRPRRSTPVPAHATHAASDSHQWRRVHVYAYTTAGGRPVQQVFREECQCNGRTHKRFRQRYREGRQWVYRKPDHFTAVLYRAAGAAARQQGNGCG